MSCGYGNCGSHCQFQCDPWEVCIQPPCCCVSIPGPVMHCDTAPCEVNVSSHCGSNGLGGYCGGYGYGGYGNGFCGGYGNGYCGGYGYGIYGCGNRCSSGYGGYGCGNRCGPGYGFRGW